VGDDHAAVPVAVDIRDHLDEHALVADQIGQVADFQRVIDNNAAHPGGYRAA